MVQSLDFFRLLDILSIKQSPSAWARLREGLVRLCFGLTFTNVAMLCAKVPRLNNQRAAFKPPWRNWLARSAVNRKVGGSSPPGGETASFHQA